MDIGNGASGQFRVQELGKVDYVSGLAGSVSGFWFLLVRFPVSGSVSGFRFLALMHVLVDPPTCQPPEERWQDQLGPR